jgi:hypothetical protein
VESVVLMTFPAVVLLMFITGVLVPRTAVRRAEEELEREAKEFARLIAPLTGKPDAEMTYESQREAYINESARLYREHLDHWHGDSGPHETCNCEEVDWDGVSPALSEAVASPAIIPVYRQPEPEIAPPGPAQPGVGLPDGYRARRWLYDHHLMPRRWFFRWLERAEDTVAPVPGDHVWLGQF